MFDLGSIINSVTVLASAATVTAVQILKSPLIPIRFEAYPVWTAAGASIVATYLTLLSQHFVFAWKNWTDIVGTFVTIFLVAALTYNQIVKKA